MDKQCFVKYLPNGLEIFQNQVAGHNSKDGKSPTGILKHCDGSVLKPLTKHPQSECEIAFYEKVQKDFACLKEFIPEFRGLEKIPIDDLEITFLKLEDVTSNLVKPCVMDVKIGARTWEPNASVQKRRAEDEKYADSKKAFGFCIPGYQVYSILPGKLMKMGKEEGKILRRETLPDAVKEFLNTGVDASSFLIDNFLLKLKELKLWWSVQTELHFYASSLLLVYDAHELEKICNGQNSTDDCSWIKVFMIDFAHVVPANNQLDYNYIEGLDNLMDLLRNIKSDKL